MDTIWKKAFPTSLDLGRSPCRAQPMQTSPKELVYQAIRFGSPERVPVVFWNRDQAEGDVMLYHLALRAPGDGTPNDLN